MAGEYDKVRYSKIKCCICGEHKIPLGQEALCEQNGKYYCPDCIHDIDADEIREKRERD